MGLGLQSENPRIATVEPQNDSKAILITGNSVGNTSIYLRDLRNPDNFAEIEVISDYLSGKFIEKGDSSSTWINGGDLHIREIIESELKEIAKNRTGILYSLIKILKLWKLITLHPTMTIIKRPEPTSGIKTASP